MNKAPALSTASGALGGQIAFPLAHDFSASPPFALSDADRSAKPDALSGSFHGPASSRQQRVLSELMKLRRLTNNDVRSIGGALNGPHIIKELRNQGLCSETELRMDWVKCIDRDGKRVRYGEYYLTANGIAKVRAWQASQPLEHAT